MISRRSNEITGRSNVADRIAAGIDLRSRVFNPTHEVTVFPFDMIEVSSAAQVTTFDGLDVPADVLKFRSNFIEIPAAAIV